MRLRAKLFSIYFVISFFVLVLAASSLSWVKYTDAREELNRIAYFVSRTLSTSIFNSLLNNRHDLIQSEINELIKQEEIQYVAVIDNNGYTLSSNAKNNEDIEIRSFSDKILTASEPGMMSILAKDNLFSEFIYPVKAGGKRWATIIVGFNDILWSKRLNELLSRVFISFVVFVIMTTVLGLILLKSLTKPLDKLMEYISQMDLSHLDISHQEISEKRYRQEEFKFLAELFQEFVTSLSNYADKLYQSREHLRVTISSMQDVLVVMDWKLEIQDVYHQEIIVCHHDDIIGKRIDEVFPLSVSENVNDLKDIAEQSRQPKSFSFNINRKNETKCFEAILTVRLNFKNEPEGFILVIRDKSVEIQAQKERDNMQQQVFHSSKLATIGELAAGIAHEINNPLAVINGYLELIHNDLDEGKRPDQNSIEALDMSVERIRNIVQGFRDYSRADKDKKEEFNIHDVIVKNVSILKGIFLKSSIKFYLDLQAASYIVYGNKSRFQQALMNFVNNARDALEEQDGAYIRISSENSGDMIIIKIKDNGPGIPDNVKTKIFESFYTTKEYGKGTGLGLSIANSIINAMDGSIEVESSPEKGTVFILNIPILHNSKTVAKGNVLPLAEVNVKVKVIVADDEETIRKLIAVTLRRSGYEVIEACNGKEALELFSEDSFDLVITDMRMPEMDGLSLMKNLREKNFSKNRIMGITGDIESVKDKECSVNDLCHTILKKPFDNEFLLQEVKRMILL